MPTWDEILQNAKLPEVEIEDSGDWLENFSRLAQGNMPPPSPLNTAPESQEAKNMFQSLDVMTPSLDVMGDTPSLPPGNIAPPEQYGGFDNIDMLRMQQGDLGLLYGKTDNPILNAIDETIGQPAKKMVGGVADVIEGVKEIVKSTSTPEVKDIMSHKPSALRGAAKAVGGALSTAFSAIPTVFFAESVAPAVGAVVEKAVDAFGGGKDAKQKARKLSDFVTNAAFFRLIPAVILEGAGEATKLIAESEQFNETFKTEEDKEVALNLISPLLSIIALKGGEKVTEPFNFSKAEFRDAVRELYPPAKPPASSVKGTVVEMGETPEKESEDQSEYSESELREVTLDMVREGEERKKIDERLERRAFVKENKGNIDPIASRIDEEIKKDSRWKKVKSEYNDYLAYKRGELKDLSDKDIEYLEKMHEELTKKFDIPFEKPKEESTQHHGDRMWGGVLLPYRAFTKIGKTLDPKSEIYKEWEFLRDNPEGNLDEFRRHRRYIRMKEGELDPTEIFSQSRKVEQAKTEAEYEKELHKLRLLEYFKEHPDATESEAEEYIKRKKEEDKPKIPKVFSIREIKGSEFTDLDEEMAIKQNEVRDWRPYPFMGQKENLIRTKGYGRIFRAGLNKAKRVIDAFMGTGVNSNVLHLFTDKEIPVIKNEYNQLRYKFYERLKNDPLAIDKIKEHADNILGFTKNLRGDKERSAAQAKLFNYIESHDKDPYLYPIVQTLKEVSAPLEETYLEIFNQSGKISESKLDKVQSLLESYTKGDKAEKLAKIAEKLETQDVRQGDAWELMAKEAEPGDLIIVDPSYVEKEVEVEGKVKKAKVKGYGDDEVITKDTSLEGFLDHFDEVIMPLIGKDINFLITNSWNPKLAAALHERGFTIFKTHRGEDKAELVAVNYDISKPEESKIEVEKEPASKEPEESQKEKEGKKKQKKKQKKESDKARKARYKEIVEKNKGKSLKQIFDKHKDEIADKDEFKKLFQSIRKKAAEQERLEELSTSPESETQTEEHKKPKIIGDLPAKENIQVAWKGENEIYTYKGTHGNPDAIERLGIQDKIDKGELESGFINSKGEFFKQKDAELALDSETNRDYYDKKIEEAKEKAADVDEAEKIVGRKLTDGEKEEIKKSIDARDQKPIAAKSANDVKIVKVKDINLDESRFQNREKLDKEHVSNIAKNFKEKEFDPIHIWKDPKDGKYYLLSGHHRLAAIKQLAKSEVKAVVRDELSEEQAIDYARGRSNVSSLQESPLERAKIYRDMRIKGKSKKEIQNIAKEREKRNSSFVVNLSYLNPKGKAFTNLSALSESRDIQTQRTAETIADWVGEARKRYPELTNDHENEVTRYLWDNWGKVKSKAELLDTIDSFVNSVTFESKKPLNLKQLQSQAVREYNAELDAKKKELERAQAAATTKRKALLNEGHSSEEVARVMRKYSDEIVVLQREYLEMKKKLGLVAKEASSQLDMFSQLEKNEEVSNERIEEIKDLDNTAGKELEQIAEDIERKAESDDEVELAEAVKQADEVIKSEEGGNVDLFGNPEPLDESSPQWRKIYGELPKRGTANVGYKLPDDTLISYKGTPEDEMFRKLLKKAGMNEEEFNKQMATGAIEGGYVTSDGRFHTEYDSALKTLKREGKKLNQTRTNVKSEPFDLVKDTKKVNELLGDEFTVEFDENIPEDATAQTDLKTNTIKIHPKRANDTTVLHEIAHGATKIMLAKSPRQGRALLKLNGWDGKGDPFDFTNQSVLDAWESIGEKAEMYIKDPQWFKENVPNPKLHARFIEKLKQIWESLRNFAKGKGWVSESKFYDDLLKGKIKGNTYGLTPLGVLKQLYGERLKGFYSKVEQLVNQKVQSGKIRANQLLAMLKNNGAKSEELEWLDLEGFLEENPNATKQELLNYIKAHNPEIEVKTYSEEDSKFDSWAVPGKEKYREVLLKLKNDVGSEFTAHFDEPNIIVHLRMDDRATKYGKTLFIEEVQSDLHQRGRKLGYSISNKEKAEYVKHLQSLDESHSEMMRKLVREGKLPSSDPSSGEWAKFKVKYPEDAERLDYITQEREHTKWNIDNNINKEQARELEIYRLARKLYIVRRIFAGGPKEAEKELLKKYREEAQRKNITEDQLIEALEKYGDFTTEPVTSSTLSAPNAPYKKTWHELGLKWALRHAVEEGYDAIAWTTGEQQVERYDLRKHIKSIDWGINYDGTYDVQGDLIKGGYYTKRNLNKEGIAEIYGKEIAEKITSASIEQDEGILEGLDLKVGGEGMKGFYDVMLPRYLNKFGKKFGARVEEGKLNTELIEKKGGRYRVFGYNDEPNWFETYREAFDYANNEMSESNVIVHTLPITDAMKSSVTQGMTLFQKVKDVEDPLKDLPDVKERLEKDLRKAENYKRESTVIKWKIHSYVKAVTTIAKEKLPKGAAKKSEIKRLLTQVKEAKDLKTLHRAVVQIDNIVDRIEARQNTAKVYKIIKDNAPKSTKTNVSKGKLSPDASEFFAMAKRFMKEIPEYRKKEKELGNVYVPDWAKGENGMDVFFLLKDLQKRDAKTTREVLSLVEGIRDAGRSEFKENAARESAFREDKVKDLLKDMGINPEKIPENTLEAKRMGLKRKSIKLFNDLHSFGSMVDYITGKGPGEGKFSKWYHERLMETHNKYYQIHTRLKEEFEEAEKRIFGEHYLGKIRKDNIVHPTNIFRTVNDREVEIEASKAQLAKRWLEWQDPDGNKHLRKMGYDENTIAKIEKFIGKRWIEFALWSRESEEKRFGEYDAAYREIFNAPAPKIKNHSRLYVDDIIRQEEDFFQSDVPFSGLTPGSAHLRTPRVKELKLVSLTDDIRTQAEEHARFVSKSKFQRELVGIMRNRDLQKALRSVFGRKAGIQHTLETSLRRDVQTSEMLATEADKIIQNTIVKLYRTVLFMPKLAVKQLTSIGSYAVYVPTAPFAKNLAKFHLHPIKNTKFIWKNMPSIRERWERGYDSFLAEASRDPITARSPLAQSIRNKTPEIALHYLAKAGRWADIGLIFTKGGDLVPVISGAWSSYKYYKDKFKAQGLSDPEAEKKALLWAEIATNSTQQTPIMEFRSTLESKRGVIKQIATFKQSPILYFQKLLSVMNTKVVKENPAIATKVIGATLATAVMYALANKPTDAEDPKDLAVHTTENILNLPLVDVLANYAGSLITGDRFYAPTLFPAYPLQKSYYSKGLAKAAPLLNYLGIPEDSWQRWYKINKGLTLKKFSESPIKSTLNLIGYKDEDLPKPKAKPFILK